MFLHALKDPNRQACLLRWGFLKKLIQIYEKNLILNVKVSYLKVHVSASGFRSAYLGGLFPIICTTTEIVEARQNSATAIKTLNSPQAVYFGDILISVDDLSVYYVINNDSNQMVHCALSYQSDSQIFTVLCLQWPSRPCDSVVI